MLSLVTLFFSLNLSAAKTGAVFYQTSFLVEQPFSALTWKALHLDTGILIDVVSALTGERFASRPDEWFHYFDDTAFEDEDPKCLNDPSSWYLVAGRALPLVDKDNSEPQLRLTFQPRCGVFYADTSIQIAMSNRNKSFNQDLYTFVHRVSTTHSRSVQLGFAGFATVKTIKTFYDMPLLVTSKDTTKWRDKIANLQSTDFQIISIQWMASLAGKLDWVFGRLERRNNAAVFHSIPLTVQDQKGSTLVSLGYYDFLPLVLRNSFTTLSPRDKKLLAPFHVTQDLHNSAHAAQEVLQIDLRVSDPARTHHRQATCIQCHSAQERIERAQTFLKYGGAKDFGYFFRGLGFIENSPYVSWRSIQESRRYSAQIGYHLTRDQ